MRKEKKSLTQLIHEITEENIFKFMNTITLAVSSIFLIKNIISGSVAGILAIGICLFVYCAALMVMNKTQVAKDSKYLIVSASLMVVISIISIFSGSSFSDDFILYLAAIALSGLYLQPNYQKVQIILADILLVIQCFCAPQKVGEMSQFIMCVGLFNFAGCLFSLVVARGRSFILDNQNKASEMEDVLKTVADMNAELNHNFDVTQERISDISAASQQVELQTHELLSDSANISSGVTNTIDTCDNAYTHIETCKGQIESLIGYIQHFESVLHENEDNVGTISSEIMSIKESNYATAEVFDGIQHQMSEIVNVLDQLKAISSSTTMLALNASIEAARAGAQGAGFAVVASKVQQLAIDSNTCSARVEQIVKGMQTQVDRTRQQILESTKTVDSSLTSIDALNNGFGELSSSFQNIYQNIGEQNENISELANSFDLIQENVSTMAEFSEKNQLSINNIAEAVQIYGQNMGQMEQDTEHLKHLAETMEEKIHA